MAGRLCLASVAAGTLCWWALAAEPARIDRRVDWVADDEATEFTGLSAEAGQAPAGGTSIGPDVIVHAVSPGINSYGSEMVSGERIHGFSVGTTSCNIGDEDAIWFDHNNQHPVIAQNLFRLKENRFEQIGMSWLKHGFFAVDGSTCGTCTAPEPHDGNWLYVGCSDPYGAGLNGTQNNLGPRSAVNAFTGVYPYPFNRNHPVSKIERRIQVRDADIDTALNPGALFFAEGHYVTTDEPAWSNHFNNASYRRVSFSHPNPGNNSCNLTLSDPLDWCATFSGSTQVEQAGIRAWKDNDPSVAETDILVPGEGLFILAAKATDLQNGFWRYEYAIQNLNSHRSGGSFRVPLPLGAVVENIGFHAPFYHSGEPYDGADWTPVVTTGAITWSTTPFEENQNANALRWGTLYNFRFDCNAEPVTASISLGLFRPGTPPQVTGDTLGPSGELRDCNGNQITDVCDLDCDVPGCVPPCGGSADCNGNEIPDECEPDCNLNEIMDECDIRDGTSEDCNNNAMPDECEPDCDDDGTPDACEKTLDEDMDGIPDCEDLCPFTSPPGSCLCPEVDGCCYPTFFCIRVPPGIDRDACIAQGGTPFCTGSPCREGCLMGDMDRDGDIDLHDMGDFMGCFTGFNNTSGSEECLLRFDFNGDETIDFDDYRPFLADFEGP